MNYSEVIDYLYARLPMFTRDGTSAFKKDLTNTLRLCQALGDPQDRIKTIHVAGTNGKGSTAHMLAAVLQQSGYKTGLYTSPHLLDFRERIRVNGQVIPKESVVNFVQSNQQLIENVQPSFFETTVVMAFDHFAREQVDIAVIETGLGGRLDSTNVITPVLSVITNIGYDHMNLLGNTLKEIAEEKAGIIKPGVPVVIGEWQNDVAAVFDERAHELGSKLSFAAKLWRIEHFSLESGFLHVYVKGCNNDVGCRFSLDLTGSYQLKNVLGVLTAVDELNFSAAFQIKKEDVSNALRKVQTLTGLKGRWHTLSEQPLVICDTGHNEDGWRTVLENIASVNYQCLHIVLGVMQDKDLLKMLPLLPTEAYYYYCEVDMPRALPASLLKAHASEYHLEGDAYQTVRAAVMAAKANASPSDLIFVGGSTFVVGELLTVWPDLVGLRSS